MLPVSRMGDSAEGELFLSIQLDPVGHTLFGLLSFYYLDLVPFLLPFLFARSLGVYSWCAVIMPSYLVFSFRCPLKGTSPRTRYVTRLLILLPYT